MALKTLAKDSNAVLDYTFDWSLWLANGETISSAVTTVTGATKDSASNSTTAVTVWVSGGTVDTSATVACRITASASRTDERTITLRIQDR